MARSTALFAAGLLCVATPAFGQGDPIEMEGDAPPADAPPSDAPPADAAVVKDPKVVKTWLKAADTLVKKGDTLTKQNKAAEAKTSYENAATAYQKAIDAADEVAAVPIQLQLADALDKSGDSVAAMKPLKGVLAAQNVKPDLTKKAQTKLDELSMKVGVVALTITPEGTTVSMGGKPIGEAPLTEPLVLMPGNHVVNLTAVGYQPKDVELKVEAGSESERKIELEPVSITTKPVDPTDDVTPPPSQPDGPSMLPIYVGGGAAAGLLLIGTVTGIAAIGKQNQYDDSVSANERSDIRSSGKTLALVTDLCFVGSLGAAAFTAYWYVFKIRPVTKALDERQAARHHKGSEGTALARRPKVNVVPWVQPDAGGLTAVGSF